MRKSNTEEVLATIVKFGLWMLPVLPLYVSGSMLFPFITGKNFVFRIVVGAIFVLWAGLAAAFPNYRPRLTPVFKAVTILMLVVFLADIFAPNTFRAFYSNYERMEGFLMFGHLYLYFVMLASVFRVRRDWHVFFHSTLLASVVVSAIGLTQKFGLQISHQGGFRVDSTIGNPTYLAAYLLFHVWLLLYLLNEYWRVKWLRYSYLGLLAFELVIMYFTATRGAILALFVTALCFIGYAVVRLPRVAAGFSAANARYVSNAWLSLLLVAEVGLLYAAVIQAGFFWITVVAFAIAATLHGLWERMFPAPVALHSERVPVENSNGLSRFRNIAASIFILLVLGGGILWMLRDTEVVRSSPALSRLVNYSLTEGTIQARFRIWNMSWQGFLERPILGWGQENYYLVFQKYFDPGLFGDEPWFDRSHSIIFDWLITGGLVGLLSYLAMFGVAFFMVSRSVRAGSITLWQGMALGGLMASYFLQNIFVFDNLNTYLLFFGVLAFIHHTGFREEERTTVPGSFGWSGGTVVVVAAFVFAFMANTLYIRPIRESKALIVALQTAQRVAPMDELIGSFERALAFQTFGDTEVREQMANLARGMIGGNQYSAEDQKRFADFAIAELRKETVHDAADVKHWLFLGSLLSRAAMIDPAYAGDAEQALGKAMELSPTKQIIYFELAQIALTRGDLNRAIDVLRSAWDLDRNFVEAGLNLWITGVLAGRTDVIDFAKTELPLAKATLSGLDRLGRAYRRIEDFHGALAVYEELVRRDPENAEYRALYAGLLSFAGRKDEAAAQAEEARRLNPAIEGEMQQLFEVLEGTR